MLRHFSPPFRRSRHSLPPPHTPPLPASLLYAALLDAVPMRYAAGRGVIFDIIVYFIAGFHY
jgi:hypothetical protein